MFTFEFINFWNITFITPFFDFFGIKKYQCLWFGIDMGFQVKFWLRLLLGNYALAVKPISMQHMDMLHMKDIIMFP